MDGNEMTADQKERIDSFLLRHNASLGTLSKGRIKQLRKVDDIIQEKLRRISEAKNCLQTSAINISTISAESGISRKTFYNNELLKKYVESYASDEERTASAKELEAAKLIEYSFTNYRAFGFQIRKAEALMMFRTRFNSLKALHSCFCMVYSSDGYNFPKDLIREFQKLFEAIEPEERIFCRPEDEKNSLPDVLKVYRATESSPRKAKWEYSWTINLQCAGFFAARRDPHIKIMEGEIKKADIIAYTNERHEFEVIQYGKVYNIKEMAMSDKQKESLMRDYKKEDEP